MQPKAKVKAKAKSAPMLDAQGRLTNVKAKPAKTTTPPVKGGPVPKPKPTIKPAPAPKTPIVQAPQPVQRQPAAPKLDAWGRLTNQPPQATGRAWTGGTPGFDERTGQQTGQPEWMSPSGAYKGAPGMKPAKMKAPKW